MIEKILLTTVFAGALISLSACKDEKVVKSSTAETVQATEVDSEVKKAFDACDSKALENALSNFENSNASTQAIYDTHNYLFLKIQDTSNYCDGGKNFYAGEVKDIVDNIDSRKPEFWGRPQPKGPESE